MSSEILGCHLVDTNRHHNTKAKALIFLCSHAHQCFGKRIQCDEIWAFTHCKQKPVATARAPPPGASDTWTWTGICALKAN